MSIDVYTRVPTTTRIKQNLGSQKKTGERAGQGTEQETGQGTGDRAEDMTGQDWTGDKTGQGT